MAILQTKTIQVSNDPAVIDRANDEWASFGWDYYNLQITHTQDTRTYTKDLADYFLDMKTVETTTIDYATIVYKRDKKMPNYVQIVELESEYLSVRQELSEILNPELTKIKNPFIENFGKLDLLKPDSFFGFSRDIKKNKVKKAENERLIARSQNNSLIEGYLSKLEDIRNRAEDLL